jgi:hypothetical protein
MHPFHMFHSQATSACNTAVGWKPCISALPSFMNTIADVVERLRRSAITTAITLNELMTISSPSKHIKTWTVETVRRSSTVCNAA